MPISSVARPTLVNTPLQTPPSTKATHEMSSRRSARDTPGQKRFNASSLEDHREMEHNLSYATQKVGDQWLAVGYCRNNTNIYIYIYYYDKRSFKRKASPRGVHRWAWTQQLCPNQASKILCALCASLSLGLMPWWWQGRAHPRQRENPGQGSKFCLLDKNARVVVESG